MLKTLGRIGKIVQIYPDNDLKIEVCGTTWTYIPQAVVKVLQPNSNETLPSTSNASISNGAQRGHKQEPGLTLLYVQRIAVCFNVDFKFFAKNFEAESFISLNIDEDLVKSAANGDLARCEYLLSIPSSNV